MRATKTTSTESATSTKGMFGPQPMGCSGMWTSQLATSRPGVRISKRLHSKRKANGTEVTTAITTLATANTTVAMDRGVRSRLPEGETPRCLLVGAAAILSLVYEVY